MLVGGPGVQAAILLLPHHHLCPRMHARHCLLGLSSHYLSDFQNDQIIVGTKFHQFKPVDLTSRPSQPIITNYSSPLLMIEVAGELLARPEGCAGEGGSRGHHPPHHVHSGHS